jgi:hypothetical protein
LGAFGLADFGVSAGGRAVLVWSDEHGGAGGGLRCIGDLGLTGDGRLLVFADRGHRPVAFGPFTTDAISRLPSAR